MSLFGLGAGLKATISINPSDNGVSLDHVASWKVRRNPFASVYLANPTPLSNNDSHHKNSNDSLNENSDGMARYPRMEGSVVESGSSNKVYVFMENDDVSGEVALSIQPGKKAEHLGVKVEFVGRIELHNSYDGRPYHDFISLSKELEPPNVIYDTHRKYAFSFHNVDKVYESYGGKNVSVRYFVRVSVERKFFPPITAECDFVVQKIQSIPPTVNDPIKMEVGIEECLHIEFEYSKRKFHLSDCITGNINFLLVRIKIKHMELALIRRESSGQISTGSQALLMDGGISSQTILSDPSKITTETQTLVKYEIMDGAPIKGETIPVRLYLKAIPADLSPTYENVNNRFTVNYFLNLVLVDEEDRRYFKQSEILLWRKHLG